jgi:tryptophan synthase beta chain
MGQVSTTHSVSAGLDYAGVGPEHAMLHDSGRVEYVRCSDQDALNACVKLLRLEGILPALESSHAIAEVIRRAPEATGQVHVVNLSGRGDKDIEILERELKL